MRLAEVLLVSLCEVHGFVHLEESVELTLQHLHVIEQNLHSVVAPIEHRLKGHTRHTGYNMEAEAHNLMVGNPH
jgi:hypothetical protein